MVFSRHVLGIMKHEGRSSEWTLNTLCCAISSLASDWRNSFLVLAIHGPCNTKQTASVESATSTTASLERPNLKFGEGETKLGTNCSYLRMDTPIQKEDWVRKK